MPADALAPRVTMISAAIVSNSQDKVWPIKQEHVGDV